MAAGTTFSGKGFIIGAGVAELQAIGTAKRLGAVVQAYDTRPRRAHVESLGGKFVEVGLDTQDSQDEGGYAKAPVERVLPLPSGN